MMPLVSILIPTYQRFDYTSQAIDCALNQTYKNIEIIVGDNKSEDGSYEKLFKRYNFDNRVLIFQNSKNIGPVLNWKECFKRANGKYIKFLWSDDLISDNYISTTVQMLEKYNKASFAYSTVYLFNKISEIYKMKDFSKSLYKKFTRTGEYNGKDFIISSYFNDGTPVSPGCAIFRKKNVIIYDVINNYIGYDHSTTGAGSDLLIFLESISNGQSFVFCNETSSYFRYHNNSISISNRSIIDGYNSALVYFLNKVNYINKKKFITSLLINKYGKKILYFSIFNKKVLLNYIGKIFSNSISISFIPNIFEILIYGVIKKIQSILKLLHCRINSIL